MRIRLVFVVVLGCLGCSQARPQPPASWSGVCQLRPVVTGLLWTQEMMDRHLAWLRIYEPAGLTFNVLPIESATDPREITFVEWAGIVLEAANRAQTRGELTVWFVDRITMYGGQQGGIASLADNALGFNWGVAVSSVLNGMPGSVGLAHEIGHAFNLRHTWEDEWEDTLAGCTGLNCNLMSYCYKSYLPECQGTWLTANQLAEVRRCAASELRACCVRSTTKVPATRVIRTQRTDPVVDPFNG